MFCQQKILLKAANVLRFEENYYLINVGSLGLITFLKRVL